MAGLLDIFGTSGGDTMGLLGMSPEDITRSRDDAQAQALYALAGRLFKGGSGASSVLEGLQQGQQAYRSAMQGGLQEQLQKAQLQELLKKKQLEEQQRQDELMARQLFQRGYQPAIAGKESMPIEEDGRFIGDSQAISAQPARFDIGSIAPELMAIGPAGQAKLKTGLELQKSMAGETFKLGEGEKQYQRNPLTGEITEVAAGAKKRETVTIGNVILDKNTMEVLYTAPDATASSIKEFQDFSKLTGPEQAAYLRLQEQKRPVTNINMPSEGERKAGLFQEQMRAASNTISSLGPVDMANKTNQAQFKGAGGLGNIAIDPKIQQYKQAADQWSESYLRVKTGAAATAPEVELNNRTFFPIFGDDAATVKLKERMRKKAEQDLGIMAGRAEVKGSKATSTEEPIDLGLSIPVGVTVKRKPS
jgi:hypothetical protein